MSTNVMSTSGSAEEYYIVTKNHEALWPRGVILFWGANRSGYSTFLEKAGRYSREQADRICGYRGGDFMVPCELIEAAAVRVVDIDRIHEFVPEEQSHV